MIFGKMDCDYAKKQDERKQRLIQWHRWWVWLRWGCCCLRVSDRMQATLTQKKKGRPMKIDVHIRKNETGEERVYCDDTEWLDRGECTAEAGVCWMYEEGNYSCDCNRELFFERARGNDPDLDDVRCSDGRFTVTKIVDRGTLNILVENV